MDIGNPAQTAQVRARLSNLPDTMDGVGREADDIERRSQIFADDEGGSLAITARRLLKESDLRGSFFDLSSFSDPAWHILLDLFISSVEKKRVSVSSLCVAARVPSSTALRWIKHLTDAGLIGRTADHEDRRRYFIHIEPQAFADMAAYLTRIAGAGVPVTPETAAPRQG